MLRLTIASPRHAAIAIAVASLTAAATAHAELDSTLPNGATVNFETLLLHEDGEPLSEPSDPPNSQWAYFNMAHCLCGASKKGDEQTLGYRLRLVNSTSQINQPGQIFVGDNCDDDQLRASQCKQIDSAAIGDIDDLANSEEIEVPVYDWITPTGGACPERELKGTTWLLVDADGTSGFDYAATAQEAYDTQAPAALTGVEAAPAENAIQLSWDTPTTNEEDYYYYQALCAEPDGTPAFAAPTNSAKYVTARDLCGLEQDIDISTVALPASSGASARGVGRPDAAPIDAGAPDAGTGPSTLPQGLAHLDSAFVCGEAAQGATSLRIGGLTNGNSYSVLLLAIDKFGNARGVTFDGTITPREVTDFWEDLHDDGSKVEGGFCLLATTFGDDSGITTTLRGFRDDVLGTSALGRWLTRGYYRLSDAVHGSWVLRILTVVALLPLIALALAWQLLGLPLLVVLAVALWQRRRLRAWLGSRRLGPLAGAGLALWLVTLAGGRTASAQSVAPYWQDESDADSEDAMAQVTWHAGLRLGPYVPQIDAQLGGSGEGPYEQMFGGYSVLPMLDVDRVIWRGFGQLTIGGSAGYMSKSAQAFAQTTDMDGNRTRSEGDDNSFTLIPLAATAAYRFTWLDDNYGIPVVPYLRGGLDYDIWWVTAPDGGAAEICTDDAKQMCSNTARGASLGFQGSVGLAIRAERIDPDAALSMRDSGLQHAGFYAEWQYAKVDGFGSDSKLSVGDSTWFAGIDFEF